MKRRTPLKRGGFLKRTTRLRPVSDRRRRESRTYAAKRAEFLAFNPYCQAWRKIVDNAPVGTLATPIPVSCPRSEDAHHMEGRHHGKYLDESTWLAVSRWSHDWIHANPREAEKLGLLSKNR